MKPENLIEPGRTDPIAEQMRRDYEDRRPATAKEILSGLGIFILFGLIVLLPLRMLLVWLGWVQR